MGKPIIYRVELFAIAKDLADASHLDIETSDRVSGAELLDKIQRDYPCLSELIRVSRLAVDDRFVDSDQAAAIDPDQSIALIPPVSGG